MPTACRKEYVITGPTKAMPRFFISALILLDTSDTTGTSAGVFHLPSMGFPPEKLQM